MANMLIVISLRRTIKHIFDNVHFATYAGSALPFYFLPAETFCLFKTHHLKPVYDQITFSWVLVFSYNSAV